MVTYQLSIVNYQLNKRGYQQNNNIRSVKEEWVQTFVHQGRGEKEPDWKDSK